LDRSRELLYVYENAGRKLFFGKAERQKPEIGPGGTGKSHLPQAIGQAAILQGYRSLSRGADAAGAGMRKQFMTSLATIPLLIIDDFGMGKLPLTTHIECL